MCLTQQGKDHQHGFAREFITVIRVLLPIDRTTPQFEINLDVLGDDGGLVEAVNILQAGVNGGDVRCN